MTDDNFLDKALERDEETIRTMFSQSADKYDFLNHLLSMNLDRGWRRTLANKSGYQNYGENVRLLDLCTGTGDVAFEFLKRDDFPGTAVGIDFSSNMLQIAQKKAALFSVDNKVEFSEGNALDVKFDNESFNLVTIAFGLRNLSNLDKGLSEMFRVLKSGGKFLSLEFFKPDSSYSRVISNFYLRCIIPVIGRIVTGRRGAYDYLPASRDKFISASEFDVKLKGAGFKKIKHGFFLFRIAALHIAEKQ